MQRETTHQGSPGEQRSCSGVGVSGPSVVVELAELLWVTRELRSAARRSSSSCSKRRPMRARSIATRSSESEWLRARSTDAGGLCLDGWTDECVRLNHFDRAEARTTQLVCPHGAVNFQFGLDTVPSISDLFEKAGNQTCRYSFLFQPQVPSTSLEWSIWLPANLTH